MGEKAIKGKVITKVLSCLVVFAILMSTFSVAVIATNSANSTASNVTDKVNSSEESIALSNNITGLTCRDDLIQININKTETVVNESGNSDLSDTSNTSSPDIINESDEVPDPDLPVINDTDIDTAKTVSSMSSCSYVWIKVTDKYCYGYKVYVDGVYQFTEGQSGTPDGYCCFKVTPGYHTFKLTLNGKQVSKGWNCQCGHVYNWMSMNDMIPHWCEDGGGNCDNPPTVNFDKSTYYEGDTVHITVHNPISGQVVDYEIIDCEGNSKEYKALPYGTSSIYYTLPTVASCCYWKICFYWNEGNPPLLGGGGSSGSYCTKCYSFYVCPHETSCKVWINVEDNYCKGYGVYVDGVYQFTEGESGTPDGYCRFYVTPGTHKFELRKNGCSVSKSWYCQCGTSYRWISMNDMYPHWCDCNKKPDLVVQDISWSPSNPKQGDTVTINVKTKNQGSGSAGGFYVGYYVDGSYYTRDYVSSLSAGSTTTTSFSWTADCGSHSIKAVADCYSDVEESNEGNNARTEYINIVCKPDLITQDIYWSPSNPKEGDTVTFSVKTKNIGSGKTGGFYVCYYVDGSYYARDYVSSLSAGSTTTTSFSWTADCGSHAIKAVADCYDAVVESDEENNWMSKGGLNIPCNPDLIIQDISLSPSNPKEGETVTFTIKTKNQGSENAGGFYVGYYVDGSYYDRDYVGSLSAGSTATTSFTTSLTWTVDEYGCKCGSILMKTVADCYNAVAESNETNNDYSYQSSITYCIPDLIIQDISWDKNSPKQGDTITFTVKIKNQGSWSAGTSTVKYYIDGSYVGSDTVPSLSVGSTSTQTFTWKANKCGDVKVKAVADATNAVDESNEGNNERTETLYIEQKKEVKCRGTVISAGYFAGECRWLVKVDKWISKGTLPCSGVTVVIETGVAPIGSYDMTIQIDDKVEVYGIANPQGGNEYCTIGLNGEGYHIKKINKKPKITVSGGLVGYDALHVFPRGSEVQVKLKNVEEGKEYTLHSEVWYDENKNLKIDSADRWGHDRGGFGKYTVTVGENDIPIPDECWVGLYRFYIEIDKKKHESDDFWIIFDPQGDGLNPTGVENYWKAERTLDRTGKYTEKYYTDHHSKTLLMAAASVAQCGVVITDRGSYMYNAKYFIMSHTSYKKGTVPVSHMKEYIEMIRDGKNRIKTDCDCNACLLIALARAMGIPARMITASGIDENNKESAHGWTEAYYSDLNLKTGWQVWDTTTGECYNMDYRGYTQQLKKSFFKEINSVKDECGVDRSPDYLAPAKKPDIIIEDISWEPKNPKEGDTVTIYVKVKNQGSGDAGEFYLDYYLEDKHYDRNFINNLSAGSSITASFAWTAKCGNWLIDVFSDYNQQVDESNETNNDRHEVIEIEYPKDAPDLVVTEIDWKPLYPKAGDSVKITATIANKGNRDAGGFYVGAFIDSSELYDNPDSVAYISSLSVGSTITTSFIWNVTQDEARHISHYIRIFADCNRAVSESNENNNKRTAIINVDEEPENVKFIGMLIRVNTPMGFSAYYFKVNKVIEGPILVGDVVRVFVWTSAQPEFLHNYDRLNISEKAEVYAEFEEELGKHYDNHVNCEVWGADITYSERYYVKKIEEKPDLIISDISMSPSSPKQGDDVKFTVTVKNIGKGTAKKSTTLIYLINGNKQTLLFLDFPSCPPLGPGVTHTYTKNAKIEDCGKYSFKAFVDVSKEVDESNEENNRRVKSFTVPCPKEKPDLTIQSISSKPENLKQGDYARFHIYIKNVGKGAAKQSYARVIVRRAISKEANIWETILDTTDLVLSLEPGKIFDDYQDVRINKCGEYKITVFVDAKHELDESDTDNNFATKSFSISGIPIYIDVHNVKTSNGYLNLPGAGTLYLYVYDSTLKRDADVAHVNFKNSPAYITVPIKVSEDIKYIRVKQWPAIKDGMFEDWGLMQISPITKNKVYTYIRSNPWITDVTFNGKHSWEVIDLNKKQEVPIRVTVKNPSANELKVKVKFYLDRNEEKAWDYSAVSDSVSIQPKGSHEFTFTYNKESTKGTWRFRVIAYNGNGYVTDQYAWTKIKGGNEKYFDPKVDGYSFSNHEAAEATVNELKNKKTFVLELLKIFPPVKEAVRKYYEKKITESDRGVCAGLSISSAEYYLKSELKPVEKNTHDMQLTNVKVLQKILYYQKGRWKLSSLFSKPNERNEYEKIKRFASEQKPMLLLLGVDGNKDPVSWTHEVVGICPCQESGNYAYIEIYDCNYPSRTSIIKMDLGENRIYYKDYKYLKVDEL